MKPYNRDNVTLARNLRKNMTLPERELWYHFLRDYPIRFQRQKPIGDYIVDFYCAKAQLAVELDGDYHGFEEQANADAIRTKALEQLGLQVMRFQNREVLRNFYGVTVTIDRTVQIRCAERETCRQTDDAD